MFRTIVTATALLASLLAGAATAQATVLPDPVSVGVVDTTTGRWHLWDPLAPPGIEPKTFFYGNPGDVPFVGDWDCDGHDTPGLYRRSDGYAYLRNSNTQGIADVAFFFGNPGDVPLAGDWNRDGCDTLSLFRPSEGRVYVINHLGSGDTGLGAADFSFAYGNPGDVPFAGDFDGDGVDTIGLHRPATGQVHLRNSLSTGVADASFTFGDPGDVILSGDWTRDDVDTVAIYRAADRAFHLRYANSGGPGHEAVLLDLAAFPYRVADGASLVPIAGRFGRARVTPFDEVPCAAGPYAGPEAVLPISPAPPDPSDATGVLGVTFTASPGCDRLTIGLGTARGAVFFPEEAVPSSHVPEGIQVSVDGNRLHVYLAGLVAGRVVEGVEFLAGPHALVVREADLDHSLYVDAWYPEHRQIAVQYLSSPARIVVDSRPLPTPPGTKLGPVVGEFAHLDRPVDAGAGFPIEVDGYARPFERSGVALVTDLATGRPAAATWSGCRPFEGGCIYTTTEEIYAWGEFFFTIDSLPPGTYELFVVAWEDMENNAAPARGVKQVFTVG